MKIAQILLTITSLLVFAHSDVGDRMDMLWFVFSLCNISYITYVGNLFNVKMVTNISNLSPTHFVSNIPRQHRYNPSFHNKNTNRLNTGSLIKSPNQSLLQKTNFVDDFNMLTFWTPGKSSSPKTFFSKISKNSKRLIACNKINHFEKLKKIIDKYFQNPEKNFFI